MEFSDLDLLRLAKAGGSEGDQAFHRLIDRHAPALFRLAVNLLPTHHDAEDLLQETFIGAFRSLETFQERSSVKTWLYAILFRQAAVIRRKHGLGPGPVASLATDAALPTPSHTAQVEARLDLQAALARLPEEYRAILILRELDGLSYDEITSLLQLPRGTVESRLHRARQSLKNVLLPPRARSSP